MIMKSITFTLALLLALASTAPAADTAATEPISLRVRFGMKDKEGQDWSGKLETSNGSVQSMRGLPGWV